MKTAHVKFQNAKHNYSTRINGTDEEIRDYFLGQWFSFDDLDHQCIAVEIQ